MSEEAAGFVICIIGMIYLFLYLMWLTYNLTEGKTPIDSINNSLTNATFYFNNSSIFNATLDFNTTTFNDTFTNFTDYEN
jgi:hypothetical protein